MSGKEDETKREALRQSLENLRGSHPNANPKEKAIRDLNLEKARDEVNRMIDVENEGSKRQ